MKILLLGATGRTGKFVVDEALRQGYQLTCLVRNPEAIHSHPKKMTIFQGSPEIIENLEKSIQGCDVVVSVLNVSRKSDFPWSALRTPKTFLSDVMTNLVRLSEKYEIKRVIICSAWGVSETKKDLPAWFIWFIDHSNIGFAYRDHERQEEVLKKSNLSWTIVRPAGLTNSKKKQEIVESFNNIPKPKFTISRLSLAKYLVNAINNKDLIHQSPVISASTWS